MTWPTTDEPRDNFVTIRLTDREAADLDDYQQRGNFKSRSAALRNCADRVIAAEKRLRKKQKKAGRE